MRRFLFSSTTTILLTGEDLEAEEGSLWAKQAPRCWTAQLGETRVLVSPRALVSFFQENLI